MRLVPLIHRNAGLIVLMLTALLVTDVASTFACWSAVLLTLFVQRQRFRPSWVSLCWDRMCHWGSSVCHVCQSAGLREVRVRLSDVTRDPLLLAFEVLMLSLFAMSFPR